MIPAVYPCWKYFLLVLFLSAVCFSCSDIEPMPETLKNLGTNFETQGAKASTRFSSPDKVAQLSLSAQDELYNIGPGDLLSLKVWGRPEVSAPKILVGPDGIVTIPRIGFIKVSGRTRESVSNEILEKLKGYYSDPEVSFSINEYKNNKAFVLGRVEHPGVVTFPGRGTLLEALSLAGGYSTEAEDTYLTKCAIIRGNDTIFWIDLNELLQNGNMALNARIINNDVIFIPESQSELVYVMGEVHKPGAYNMMGRLTLLDSLMMAGGPTEDAKTTRIYLIRRTDNGEGKVQEIDLQHLLESADFSKNFIMRDDDVLYVSEKRISKFNYILRKIFPSGEMIKLGTDMMYVD